MKKLIRVIHSVIWWIDWVVIMLAGIVLDSVIWPKNKKMYRKAERFWAWTLMKIGGIKLEITGQENLPVNETVVYMANHQSDLDWPVIFRAIPGEYLFLAKQELFNVPIFGTYMRLQNYIPIERTSIRKSFNAYQLLKERIDAGNSIVLYPEGTRSYNEKLQRFKSFSFAFLKEARVRVVPIAIVGSINIQRRGSKLIHPGTVKVKILPPIGFDELYTLEIKEFSQAASNRVREALLIALKSKEEDILEKTKGNR